MSAGIFECGEFKRDCDRFELSRAGRCLKLERMPMELLILLVSRNGNLVTRSEIAGTLWEPGVFVDIEHGINTAVRKIRYALRDDPAQPKYVQTVSGKGYRFISDLVMAPQDIPVNGHGSASAPRQEAILALQETPLPDPLLPPERPSAGRRFVWPLLVSLTFLAVLGVGVYSTLHSTSTREVEFTRLTDFADSASAPALSPDGRMLAFIRGSDALLATGQIYVKMLPDGEPRRLTDDSR